jgi:hypothetical protein
MTRKSGLVSIAYRDTPRDTVLLQEPYEPLVSFRINRQFSGRNLPPLMFRASGPHCYQATSPLAHFKESYGADGICTPASGKMSGSPKA